MTTTDIGSPAFPAKLGEPHHGHGLTLAPLIASASATLDYLTLEEALPLGLIAREVDASGSVGELIV